MGKPQQRKATTTSIAAPLGGWNARDSIAEMNPMDAVTLENFFPTPSDVTLRKGYSKYSVITTSTGVQTISSITYAGTLATLTTASAHGLTTGRTISITGCTPSVYNGIYTITVTGANTLTYVLNSPPASNATVVGAYTIQVTDQVQSLMNYSGPTTEKLFAVCGNSIYECTTSGVATQVFTGLSNSQFQHVNVSTVGGHFLVACNGADPTLIYDGSNWSKVSTTDTAQTISSITYVGTLATLTTASAHGLQTGNRVIVSGAAPTVYNGTFIITVLNGTQFTYTMSSTPATNATVVGSYSVLGITGVNSNSFINVNLFKNRLFFTQEASLKTYYLDVNSIGGAATGFDFNGVARNGGFLQAVGTWTLDAGQGADDYFVAITNMGEVIIYVGTDITDPANWALKGVWQFGQTFNRRCFFKYAGDLLLLTQDGLVPLSGALQSSRLDPRINITDKIYYAVSQAATNFYDQFGWQVNYFASENMLILNVPITDGVQQFVMHTITKSWGQFTGLQAYCWEVSGKNGMYFGSDGYVGWFYSQASDNGSNITGKVQQAYSYFDSRGTLKRFTMARPIIITDNTLPTVLCNISIDFDPVLPAGEVTYSPSSAPTGKWDSAKWDTSTFTGGFTLNKVWQGVTGIGFAGGLAISVASQGVDFHWASTDIVFETGGVL
jgi:hypothetical protein